MGKLDNLIVEISQDSGGSGSKKPMALVRIPNDHDLVLEFHFMSERKKFLAKLEAFLQSKDWRALWFWIFEKKAIKFICLVRLQKDNGDGFGDT